MIMINSMYAKHLDCLENDFTCEIPKRRSLLLKGISKKFRNKLQTENIKSLSSTIPLRST